MRALPKSMRQKMKLLYLIDIFSRESDDEHVLSINDLIRRLDSLGIKSERKSIYNDIDCLREYGVDIERRDGKNGGYFIAERDFELPELKLLVDAVQSSKFITASKSSKLIKKIGSLCSEYEERKLDRSVFVANRVKAMNESIYFNVDAIHNAMTENRKIQFRYFEWKIDGQKHFRNNGDFYRASPWSLVWDDEYYYLVAFDEKSRELRHYRVDKMSSISELDEEREGKNCAEDFDTALYSKQMFGMFGGESAIVTLLCENSLAGVIFDRFGRDIIPRFPDKGHFEIDVRVSVSPVFIGWVFGFNGKIKIISPDFAREEYRNMLLTQLSDTESDYRK